MALQQYYIYSREFCTPEHNGYITTEQCVETNFRVYLPHTLSVSSAAVFRQTWGAVQPSVAVHGPEKNQIYF